MDLRRKIAREENIKNFKRMIKFILAFGFISTILLISTGCCRVVTTAGYHHFHLREMISAISGSADTPMEIRKSAPGWLRVMAVFFVLAFVMKIFKNQYVPFIVFSAIFFFIA